jgi:hypothetical protein
MLADSRPIAHPNHRAAHKGKQLSGRWESVGCKTWLVPARRAAGEVKDPLAVSLSPTAAAPSHIFVVTGRDS